MLLSGLSGYYIVYLLLTLLLYLLLRRRLFSRKRLSVMTASGGAFLLGALLPFSLSLFGRLETAVATILITLLLSYFIARDFAKNDFTENTGILAAQVFADTAAQQGLPGGGNAAASKDLTAPDQRGERLYWYEQGQSIAFQEIAAAMEQEADGVEAGRWTESETALEPESELKPWPEPERKPADESEWAEKQGSPAEAFPYYHAADPAFAEFGSFEDTGIDTRRQSGLKTDDAADETKADCLSPLPFFEFEEEDTGSGKIERIAKAEKIEKIEKIEMAEIKAGSEMTAESAEQDLDDFGWRFSDEPINADFFSQDADSPGTEPGEPPTSPDGQRFWEELSLVGSLHDESGRLLSRFEEELDRVDDPSLTGAGTLTGTGTSPGHASGAKHEQDTSNRK
jgi:hypothetical protein